MSQKRTTIGVFDSGVGGLTVLRELFQQLPNADYLYFGDTARLPYGSKSAETVAKYAISAAKYLCDQGAEHLVIACNTACALAFEQIRAAVKVPVFGVIEPGAERAASISHSKKVAVIATEGTVSSHAYKKALAARGVTAEETACPLFVPLVEEGWTDHPVTEEVANIYLNPILNRNHADALVLGCTHYPLLKPLLRRIVPNDIEIIDSAHATAQAMAARLQASAGGEPTVKFFVTDSAEKFRLAGEKFLGRKIQNVTHVDVET